MVTINRLKIGILIIATGKYITFASQLVKSVNKHFFNKPNFSVTVFVFTDSKVVPKGTVRLYKEFKDFPHPTLTRYHSFYKYRNELSKMDYLFYCDVDMKFVARIGEEILGKTVGVLHPGYYNSLENKFPYEKNPKSTAYVESGKHYFCGGFNGGKTKQFLQMAKIISENVDADLKNNIVARVHDESHINKYFINHPPDKILDPGYCYPEGEQIPFKPKLVALNKNHAVVRYTGLSMLANLIKEQTFIYLIHKPVLGFKRIFNI